MSDRAIIEAVSKMTGMHKMDPVTYVNASVTAVDISKRICTVVIIDGHTEYELPNVRLMAVVDDGLILEPALNSVVKILFSQNIEPCVVQYSEIENVIIDAKQKIRFNDGSYGGLVKIEELTKKINNLESDINTLKSLMASWIPVPSDGGASLKGLISSWAGQSLTVTTVNDLENKKITHGK